MKNIPKPRQLISLFTMLLACAGVMAAGDIAVARNNDQGKGPSDNKGQQQAAKHKHNDKNGHDALGEKLKQNGKHDVGKFGNRTVMAEVQNGKVKNMSASDLPAKRVKSKMKMASLDGGIIPVAAGGGFQLAQYGGYTDYYYGFCFDDGYDFTCYWYLASEVNYLDYTWEDYSPYYNY
jgi:hypothetical protein